MGQFEESFAPSSLCFADPDPLSNCFKTGTSADFPRIPEDARAVNQRSLDWVKALTPQNFYHCWMIDQVAVASIRIDHINRVERRARDRDVLRAGLFWDEDRRLDAEKLGDSLAKAPAQAANKLRRTPQGCDWMIARWARLARIADLSKAWDEAQTSLAFDLLGTRAEDRIGKIGEVIDDEGRVVSESIDLAEIARGEIAGLRKRREEVAGLDTLDRAMAEADYVAVPSYEVHQIHRQGRELHRQMKWYVGQIRAKSPYPHTKPEVYDHFHNKLDSVIETPDQPATPPVPSDPAEAPTAEPSPIPAPRIATAEFDENGQTWPYLVAARREAQDRKNQAREEARYESRRRRRA